MPYKFDLFFSKPKRGEIGSPFAYIYVKNYSRDKEGRPLLTPLLCLSSREITYYVDSLKEELEILKKKAEQKFVKTNK
ncbi:MAG: hypothetical protein ACREOW_10260 [Thermodesulfobacteriota bacterium]